MLPTPRGSPLAAWEKTAWTGSSLKLQYEEYIQYQLVWVVQHLVESV